MKIKHKKTAEIGVSKMTIFTVNIAFGIDSTDTKSFSVAPTLITAVEDDVKEAFKTIELLKKSRSPPMDECKGNSDN